MISPFSPVFVPGCASDVSANPDNYIIKFWVGLMDGDGSIQVNHWRKQSLQFRLVIKLKYDPENVKMLSLIQTHVGGRVRTVRGPDPRTKTLGSADISPSRDAFVL